MEKKTPAGEILCCSFCKKTQNDVRKLVAGPEVNICDECVEVCVDIMLDGANAEGTVPDSAEARRWQSAGAKLGRRPGACSLCGREAFSLLTITGRGLLCGECADAVEDALARGRPVE
jgi:hypothetical protein